MKLESTIQHPLFPSVDVALRSGKHISHELVAEYLFLNESFPVLAEFYGRYRVDLLNAPEGYFYLRPQSTSLIARTVLSSLEMLIGKVLCLLYLDPNRLANDGIVSMGQVLEQLFGLVSSKRLMQLVHPRASGSDLDRARLLEKVKSALLRLRRMGMLVFCEVHDTDSKSFREETAFKLTESVFRFAAELRSDAPAAEAQRAFILQGEAIFLESQPTAMDTLNEKGEALCEVN